jgi:putative sigma-54 modulation protein
MYGAKLGEVDETARANIVRRLLFRFDRFSSRIDRVRVRIMDINGPRGGADKACKIDVRLRPTGNIIVQDIGEDFFRASDRASERAARSISRFIKRAQGFERAPAQVYEPSSLTWFEGNP